MRTKRNNTMTALERFDIHVDHSLSAIVLYTVVLAAEPGANQQEELTREYRISAQQGLQLAEFILGAVNELYGGPGSGHLKH